MTQRMKPPEKQVWLTHEEIVVADTDALRAAYNKAITNMTDKQVKLVTGMLEGKTDQAAAADAGYSMNATNYGWRARKTKAVVHALAIGREIASRGAETTPEWVRAELKALMERAKAEGDNQTVIACAREFCKIDGMYAAEQMKLMHANHEGGSLNKEITDDEWLALAALQHEMRIIDGEVIEEDTVH